MAIRRLSIFDLNKAGVFARGRCVGTASWGDVEAGEHVEFEADTEGADPFLRVFYTAVNTQTGDRRGHNHHIYLDKTPCRYGRHRYWYLCPMQGCGKRVAILYVAGIRIACRRCLALKYASKQYNWHSMIGKMDRWWRMQEQEKRIRVKFWRGQPTRRYERFERKYCLASAGAFTAMRR